MDLNTLQPISIVTICIILASFIIAYIKKIMMTYALLIANFIIFVLTVLFTVNINGANVSILVYQLGFRPEYLSLENIPHLYTLFTSMFIHGGFAHILGNMLVFFFMGVAFEQRIGWKNFLFIYLLTGIFAALTHSILNFGSPVLLIGASGAIFGILGAFAYSYPRDEVVMPIPLGIIMVFRRVKVMYAALIFAVLETVIVMFDVQDNTAHYAHIGGLVSGVILAAILIGNRGEKTSQAYGTVVYQDLSQIPKKGRINYDHLRELATTPELKEILGRIENETLLQVRDMWLDHFLEKTTCPQCGKPLLHHNRKIWCEENHFRTDY